MPSVIVKIVKTVKLTSVLNVSLTCPQVHERFAAPRSNSAFASQR